jgi:hypothetical protein
VPAESKFDLLVQNPESKMVLEERFYDKLNEIIKPYAQELFNLCVQNRYK